jgi:hypothetical protein
MKMLKFGLVFAFALLAVGQAFDMLYHPDISRQLVTQHQMEMRELAAARRLERQARSSTTRRGNLAHRASHRALSERRWKGHCPVHTMSARVSASKQRFKRLPTS